LASVTVRLIVREAGPDDVSRNRADPDTRPAVKRTL